MSERSPRTLLARPPLRAGRATPQAALLLACVVTLLVLGLLMSFSASFVRATAELGDPFGIARRQVLWALVGVGIGWLLARADHRILARWSGPLVAGALVLCLLLFIPGLGLEGGGARRWLAIGPVTMQPSEVLKLAVPLYLATVLGRRADRVRAGDVHALLMPALPLLVVAFALVVVQPDLETAGLVAGIGGVVLLVAGLPARLAVLGGSAVVAAAVTFIAGVGWRRDRVDAWLDPAADAGNLGYQSVQGYLALASGGLTGTGLGESRAKWLYLPNADTDFIFAIIGEELGFLGALLVVALYSGLAIAGIRTARAAPDTYGRLLATGITAWLLMQASMNIGSVVGLLPVTGVTLPLVSVGGTSLVVTLAGCGVLLSVARAARPPEPEPGSDGRASGSAPASPRDTGSVRRARRTTPDRARDPRTARHHDDH
ncbi:putative lipid II flippase FtsW [Egibacter rhizosphaerae]|uniref:putative lipid II flippase FtsW n=1 Tax=Egibacter rhizosphaerae TaxID=1670831 RepID=UPI0013F154B9|nr:putative lipid II flippase FtsW [Egibacter rhizosphaerae]